MVLGVFEVFQVKRGPISVFTQNGANGGQNGAKTKILRRVKVRSQKSTLESTRRARRAGPWARRAEAKTMREIGQKTSRVPRLSIFNSARRAET